MFSFEIRLDKSKLDRIIAESPQRATDFVEATARMGQAHVMDSFGDDGSPSSPGGVPGIDTGALKNSISVTETGTLSRSISVGVEYGLPLEFGTTKMAARPFMLPMAVWLADQITPLWREFIDV